MNYACCNVLDIGESAQLSPERGNASTPQPILRFRAQGRFYEKLSKHQVRDARRMTAFFHSNLHVWLCTSWLPTKTKKKLHFYLCVFKLNVASSPWVVYVQPHSPTWQGTDVRAGHILTASWSRVDRLWRAALISRAGCRWYRRTQWNGTCQHQMRLSGSTWFSDCVGCRLLIALWLNLFWPADLHDEDVQCHRKCIVDCPFSLYKFYRISHSTKH